MDVLNGLAWDADTESWLVTGKFWPELHRVQFVPR
jgi:glutamine cyclotransferase